MSIRAAVALLLALLATAGPAAAQGSGDPIMPLGEVRQGMECKGYSVVRGTEPAQFDVEILDIVGGDGGVRLLVKVSGAAVDDTGIGAGFSGSPIYCPASDGKMKNAGAISETIGEFGGRTVLATPIELILAAAVDPPAEPGASPPAGARSLAAPLSIRGLSGPVFRALARAARARGRTLLQAPPASLAQAPASPFKPGSAMSIGLSSGDLSIGAIGTVAYVDGDRIWALGHPFDGVGRRSLFLQNAYVAGVINNPIQLAEAGATYKLAGATGDVGTITNDTFSAVAGRVGGLPAAIPVRVFVKDLDSGREATTEVNVAEETDVGTPAGNSALSFVAPLTVTQAATAMYDSTPARILGEMCLRIAIKERPKPLRICNRYVGDGTGPAPGAGSTNLVALRAGTDVSEALALIDAYKPAGLHVTEVAARIRLRRGQHQAFMRDVRMPARVRPGQRVTVRMTVRRVRGARQTIRFPMTIPRHLGAGERRFVFRGANPDSGDEELFGTLTIDLSEPDDEAETTGPETLSELVGEIRKLQRYDGIRVSAGGSRRAHQDEDLRVGGRAETTVTVTR